MSTFTTLLGGIRFVDSDYGHTNQFSLIFKHLHELEKGQLDKRLIGTFSKITALFPPFLGIFALISLYQRESGENDECSENEPFSQANV